MPYLVQKDLNKIARNYGRQQMMGQGCHRNNIQDIQIIQEVKEANLECNF
jgi:hypothetical protein